jgi:hypothetical protein
MPGVENMTVAINPADNSLIVVIELLLWMQQTTRDYSSGVELVLLGGVPITVFACRFGLTDGYANLDLPILDIRLSFKACIQCALLPLTVIESRCSIGPIVLKTVG